MHKFLAIVFAFSAFSAQASVENYFETLKDLFDHGEAPEIDRILNVVWSGRCFMEADPNPMNAGYVIRKGADLGPIGGNKPNYEAASVWQPTAGPTYYDSMELSEFNRHYSKNYQPIQVSDSITMELDAGEISTLKKSGEYLVEEISRGSEVGVRCYYFKKEQS